METLLCLHATLNYGSTLLSNPTAITNFQSSLNQLKDMIITGVSRGDGTREWHYQKFLEMDHFLDDILEYGSAAGFNTSMGERGLKKWAKAPASTAQNRGDEIFTQQLTSRIFESKLLDLVVSSNVSIGRKKKVTSSPKQDGLVVPSGHILSNASFWLRISRDGYSTTDHYSNKSKQKKFIQLPKPKCDWFYKEYKDKVPEEREELTLPIYT